MKVNEMEALLYTQNLVDNDKTIRMRTLNKLKKFLTRKSSNKGFKYDELIKTWKGLYYCLYNSDKPIVQEDLAEEISCLIHFLGPNDQKIMFFQAALETFTREWCGIDKFRLDKYFMLFTRVLRQCFVFLLKSEWSEELVKKVSSLLENTIVSPFDYTHSVPLGMKLHLADIILEELAKIGKETLPTSVLAIFILPFIKVLAVSKDKAYISTVRNSIFDALIKQTDAGIEMKEDLAINEVELDYENEEEANKDVDEEEFVMDPRAGGVDVYLPQLKPDFRVLSQLIQSVGSMPEVSAKNRKLLYSYVRKFINLSEGLYPFSTFLPDTSNIPSIKQLACKEIASEIAKTRKRKKVEDIVNIEQEEVEIETAESESMKKKEERRAAVKRKNKRRKAKISRDKVKSKQDIQRNLKKQCDDRNSLSTKLRDLSQNITSSLTGANVFTAEGGNFLENSPNFSTSQLKLQMKSGTQMIVNSEFTGNTTHSNLENSNIVYNHAKKDSVNSFYLEENISEKPRCMVFKNDGWHIIKLVPKLTDSNKLKKGKKMRPKRLQGKQCLIKSSLSEKKEISKIRNQEGLGKINMDFSNKHTGKMTSKKSFEDDTPQTEGKEENFDGTLNRKCKTQSLVAVDNELHNKNIKESSCNANFITTRVNRVRKAKAKSKIGKNPQIASSPKSSLRTKKNATAKTKSSTSDRPWLDPLKEGEIEIVVPSRKYKEKFGNALSPSKMVIKKIPTRNTKGRTLKINLENNEEHDIHHYQKVLRLSPAIPFSAHKRPNSSVLKSPSLRKSLKSSQIKIIRKKFNL